MLITDMYTKETNSSAALKCHQCRSDVDRRCEDIKSNMFLKVCDRNSSTDSTNVNTAVCQASTEYYCRKTKQTIQFLAKGPKTIVLRECTTYVRLEGQGCQSMTSPDQYTATICECKDKDGCNESPRTRTISWLITFLSVLRVFFPP
ncbi:hypothetical protein QE152_g18182 [Popillia japonica]|uniref:Protein quiver n=1 Tax=Popillia japonica TaxID=7064 RepID=A0AAW1L5B9_POPJA